jgi:hypothetical protein
MNSAVVFQVSWPLALVLERLAELVVGPPPPLLPAGGLLGAR